MVPTAALRCTESSASSSDSIGVETVPPPSAKPALLTRTSMRPNASIVRSTAWRPACDRRDVSGVGQGAATGTHDLVGYAGCRLGVDVVDDHRVAPSRQREE